MPTNYERLLTEPNAQRVLIVETHYHDGVSEKVLQASRGGWTASAADGLADPNWRDLLTEDFSSESGIDRGETYGGLAVPDETVLELDNTNNEFNAWREYRVEGYDIIYMMVGVLKDGTVVNVTEARETPLLRGVGIGRPQVSAGAEGKMTIGVNGPLYQLRRKLNSRFFNPYCLEFPGTSLGLVDWGDNFDAAGAFSWAGWIYAYDPSKAGQILLEKDTGSAGIYLDLGTAGNGVLRFGIRNQTPATTDTAAGIIRIRQPHFVEVTWDPSTSTRTILVDGVSIASTAAITGGSPGGNSASLKMGRNFTGWMSKASQYSVARTPAQSRADMFLPLVGTETNLAALPLLAEGQGDTTADSKAGSSVTGSLGPGVVWISSSWCGPSLVGKRWPLAVGQPWRVPLVPIDPGLGIFAVSSPAPVAPPRIYSNHNLVSSGYTYDTSRGVGLITLSGAATGSYSADIPGETPWRGAVSYDGSTGYASGTVICPAGTMSLAVLVRPDATAAELRCVAGWTAGGAAGQRLLAFSSTATNLIRMVVRNDAGTAFVSESATPLQQGRVYRVVGVLDTSASVLRLYVDGALMATTAVTGTFTTTATAFTLARNSTSGIQFFAGLVDDVSVWSRALTLEDNEALTAHPDAVTTTSRTHYWACNEATGATLANTVGGGPSLTLSGTYTWTQSRIAPADGVLSLVIDHGGKAITDFSLSTVAAFVRDDAGDCQALITGDETGSAVVDAWLRGVTAFLRPGPLGLFEMGKVKLYPGAPDAGADFNDGSIPLESTVEPAGERITAPPYGVNFLHARNHSPQDPSQLAGILTTQPEAYQFGQRDWADGLYLDATILGDFPQAEIFPVESPYLHLADAMAESRRCLPLYHPDREPLIFELDTPGLRLLAGGHMRVTMENPGFPPEPLLGMASPGRGFLVLNVSRNGESVTVRAVA